MKFGEADSYFEGVVRARERGFAREIGGGVVAANGFAVELVDEAAGGFDVCSVHWLGFGDEVVGFATFWTFFEEFFFSSTSKLQARAAGFAEDGLSEFLLGFEVVELSEESLHVAEVDLPENQTEESRATQANGDPEVAGAHGGQCSTAALTWRGL